MGLLESCYSCVLSPASTAWNLSVSFSCSVVLVVETAWLMEWWFHIGLWEGHGSPQVWQFCLFLWLKILAVICIYCYNDLLNYDWESPNLAQEISCSTWRTIWSEDKTRVFKLCCPCVMQHIFLLHLCTAASAVLLNSWVCCLGNYLLISFACH